MLKNIKNLQIVILVVVGPLLVLEIALRYVFGLGNPLIYIADGQIGYLFAPNQKIERFGKRIEINEYSMRSSSIAPQPGPNKLRILLLGDSVANGGWWTDQDQTIAALMQSSSLSSLEVFNIATGSWGPRNMLAYLEKFGLFKAQKIILLLNTDDLFADAPNSLVVGRDPNYPDHKPRLAIFELFTRYLFPKQDARKNISKFNSNKDQKNLVNINLLTLQRMKNLATQNQAHFLLAMTPLQRELDHKHQLDYEKEARSLLLKFTQENQIDYIDFLPIFQSAKSPHLLYRDHIHLSPEGNQLVSDILRHSQSSF